MHQNVMSPDALSVAWGKLRPGETLVYHTGILGFFDEKAPGAQARAELGAAARDLYTSGVAELTQKRFADFVYEYRATMRVKSAGQREWPMACARE